MFDDLCWMYKSLVVELLGIFTPDVNVDRNARYANVY